MARPGLHYRPLNHSRDEIRLLEIDVSDEQDHSLLQGVSLARLKQPFAALSYTWGDQEPHTITVDGKPCTVSWNLQQAIEAVIGYCRRTPGRQHERLLLWCDQLCINQDDDAEKAHQVSFMRCIYSKAILVFAWLGVRKQRHSAWDETISDVPADMLSTMKQGWDLLFTKPTKMAVLHKLIHPRRLQGWREWQQWHLKHIRRATDVWPNLGFSTAEVLAPEDTPLLDALPDGLGQMKSIKAFDNIQKLACSQWWTRTWVYQECMLASDIIFLFDDQAARYVELHDFVDEVSPYFHSFMATVLACIAARCAAQVAKSEDSDTDSDQQAVVAPSSKVFLEHMFGRLASVSTAATPIWNNAWDRMNFMLRHRSFVQANDPDARLSSLVRHVRNCEGADDRDKLFALLGIISRSYGIVPDYSPANTLVDVILSATISVIETEQTLDFLLGPREQLWLSEGSNVLPSWALNLTTPDEHDVEFQRFKAAVDFDKDYAASKRVPPFAFFIDDSKGRRNRRLACRAIRICRLEIILEEAGNGAARKYGGENGKFQILALPSTQRGNEVWVLLGACVPFVLAKTDAKNNDFELRGPALVCDASSRISQIMTGRMIELVEEGRRQEEVIWIV